MSGRTAQMRRPNTCTCGPKQRAAVALLVDGATMVVSLWFGGSFVPQFEALEHIGNHWNTAGCNSVSDLLHFWASIFQDRQNQNGKVTTMEAEANNAELLS